MAVKQGAYAADGVNTAAGDEVSAFAATICRNSFHNSPFVKISDWADGHFRGPRSWLTVGMPPTFEEMCAPDGNGTKVAITDAAGFHMQAARDNLAMTAGDITRWGGIPMLYSSVLDLTSVGEPGSQRRERLLELFRGLGEAAEENRMVIFNGETAELGPCVGSAIRNPTLPFNWAGFALGRLDPKRIINGKRLAHGQPVIALQERGFRANGMSTVRKTFEAKFGTEWSENPDAQDHIKEAAAPSILYDRLLTQANGWNNPEFEPVAHMTFIAHITGGGIRDKFCRDTVLRYGFSAELFGLYDPPSVMKRCAEWRQSLGDACFDNEEFYATLNGGQGALVVLENEEEAEVFLNLAKQHGIEAKHCGQILETKGKPRVTITSMLDGRTFHYE